ncbi:MAG: hypothetical protein LBM75_10845 [Myxococcales bacterium]|jgi:uncharacterized protein YfaS (alpha-2-macroglobulin family)|nr:hypothetical protein [Myxococcales bacterium]
MKAASALHCRALSSLLLVVLMSALAALAPAWAAPAPRSKPIATDWKAIDRLIEQGKFERASKELSHLRAQAMAAKDEATWARALIREAELPRDFEAAVNLLMSSAWPSAFEWQAALHLAKARALIGYLAQHRYDIDQRERLASTQDRPISTWTRAELRAEIDRAFFAAWQKRERLAQLPFDTFKDVIERNDFPEKIRPTPRDAVTYLWVEALADSFQWRPEQRSGVFALSTERLLRPDPALSNGNFLTDEATHPLLKIAVLLGDLEHWHLSTDAREAALETLRVRLETLAPLVTAAQRDVVLADFDARLGAFSSAPWWAMGMASLADQLSKRDRLEDQIRALALARSGREAFPDSAGAQRCNDLIARLELPRFELSSGSVDGPRKRSLSIEHANVKEIFLRAYPVDLVRLITRTTSQGWSGSRHIEEFMRNAKPAAAWSVRLTDPGDYRAHRTFLVPPLDRPGGYFIVASLREDFDAAKTVLQGRTLMISKFVITRDQYPRTGELRARVLDARTGAPIAGATVEVYRAPRWDSTFGKTVSAVTDAAGEVALRPGEGNFFLVARKDGEVTLDPWPDYDGGSRSAPSSEDHSRALVYTDRGIYRPGQTISWKIVPYRGNTAAARFSTLRTAGIEVALVDANHQRVALKKVESNAFGSASGEFEIPVGRALGEWQIRVSLDLPKKKDGLWLGVSRLRVEEYKRPTFEVALDPTQGAAKLNAQVSVAGSAHTYFGTAVNAGAAKWTVERRPLCPPRFWWRGPPCRDVSELVAAGEATLDAEGRFRFDFTPRADPQEAKTSPDKRYLYAVRVDVTDQGGETRSASRVFRLGWRSIDASIELPAGFLDADKPAELTVSRTSLDGTPRRGGEGRFWVTRLALPKTAPLPADLPRPRAPGHDAHFDLPGDTLRPRWAPGYSMEEALALQSEEAQRVAEGAVKHDDEGIGRITLTGLAAGAYRLRYETQDDAGQIVERTREFVVASPKADLALPALLIADRSSAKVGESARLFVHAGRPGQRMLLEVFRDQERVSHQWLVTGTDKPLRELPIRDEDRGGLTVRLTTVMDWQSVTLSADIAVPFDDRELQVEWESFRDHVQPGSRERFRVTVKRLDGKALDPREAELLAYIYDRSLEAFAPHTPANPLALLPSRRGLPAFQSSVTRPSDAVRWGQTGVQTSSAPAPSSEPFTEDAFKGMSGASGPGRRFLFEGGGNLPRRMRAAASPAPMAMKSVAGLSVADSADSLDSANSAEAASPLSTDPGPAEAEHDAPSLPLVRADFRETALWAPALLLNQDGSATLEFTVPDALTSWRVWAVALTRQLHAGIASRTFQSVRELMVRPRLPRFLREGDRADLAITVDSASDAPIAGQVRFELTDPETGADLLPLYGLDATAATASFSLAPGKSQTITFPLQVPPGPGPIEVKVTARTADGRLSDGELRPLPILPSRAHLSESRFAALRGNERRTLSFEVDASDASLVNEALVVTLDAQLLDGALAALPYLVRYPYECVEQTLNRFVSTGILTGLFERFPSLGGRAKLLAASRSARLETFDQLDPNRKLSLEETPWLRQAKGGAGAEDVEAIALLNPEVAKAERDSALSKLRKAQQRGGGFAWWAGGTPSPYMTLYVLAGLARAAEFGGEIPEDIAVKAWRFMSDWYGRELDVWITQPSKKDEADVALATFLNYVATAFDGPRFEAVMLDRAARQKLLDFSFKRRKELSNQGKGQLALTLKRMGREADARLVFDAVMDAAKTTPEQGTFWQTSARSWLWYRDTIDSHAFSLRVLTELSPEDPRRAGLAQWLFLNKKLNHWKSTRASAEAIYALAHYAQSEHRIDATDRVRVTLGSKQEEFVFQPTSPTSGARKRQMSLTSQAIDARALSAIELEQMTPGIVFASATWHFSTESEAVRQSGDLFSVRRTYFRRVVRGREHVLEPLAEGARLKPGDEVEVQLVVSTRHAAEYVHLRDPRAAGLEPVEALSGYRFDQGLAFQQEVRDSATNFFFDRLPAGEFTLRHRLKASMVGTFRVSPATLQSMYAPEFTAHSSGSRITIQP